MVQQRQMALQRSISITSPSTGGERRAKPNRRRIGACHILKHGVLWRVSFTIREPNPFRQLPQLRLQVANFYAIAVELLHDAGNSFRDAHKHKVLKENTAIPRCRMS